MAANPSGEEKSPAQSRGVTPARIAAIGVPRGGRDRARGRPLRRRRRAQVQPALPERQPARPRQPGPDRRPAGRLGRKHRADRRQPGRSRGQRPNRNCTRARRRRSAPPRSPASPTTTSRSAPGPNSNPPLDDGATLGLADTTTPVDLDQLFNTFPPRCAAASPSSSRATRSSTPARGKAANDDLQVLRPVAQPHQRLRRRTQRRRAPLRPLRRQLEPALDGGLRTRRRALQRDLQRQHRLRRDRQPERRLRPQPASCCRRSSARANTTFVNLRAALDDLDPLVETAKPATKDLAPFLAELRPVLSKSVPVFKNLRLTVRRQGFANDAAELLAALPAVQQRASQGLPALRRRDRRLPAEPQLLPRLHAGHLQRLRQARPGHRLLRRQRPLRPRSASPASTSSTSTPKAANCEPIAPSEQYERLRRIGGRQAALPRRRHASRRPTAPTPSPNRPSAAPA